MRVIGGLIGSLDEIKGKVQTLESLHYDSGFSAEINNDPFLPLMLAAEHSEKIELMTSIAVAFARNPMTLANTAHDLNEYSGGRFVLGIGSQIKPHITRRLSMPWSKPASRMREFVLAMRAIWDCWHNETRLNFEGEFYTHTLMTPMFTPAQRNFSPPKVKVAAVGPRMTEVAAEVADGMIAHGFTTEKYLREVTMPAVEKGLLVAGKSRQDFDVCCPVTVVAGLDEEAFMRSKNAVKMQLAFYASTPAYENILAIHGWQDVHEKANRLSKEGKWQEMGELMSDEMLNTFAIVCEDYNDVAAGLKQRYAGLVDSWQCTVELADNDAQSQLVRAARQA